MQMGRLEFTKALVNLDLVAHRTAEMIEQFYLDKVMVSEIDGSLSDTVQFCEHYAIGLDQSANCVIVEAKRADRIWYAACTVLATNRADINGIVRKYLEARKISFAPMDVATSLTKMMYGGITPIGLPSEWPLLVDKRVSDTKKVIVGSGLRKSKLLVPGSLLADLPNAVVMDLIKSV